MADTSKPVKINNIYLTCTEDETYTYSSNTSDNPLEDGSIASDNIQSQPTQIQITGILIGDGEYPQDNIETLRNYMLKSTVVTYCGTKLFPNCAIINFSNKHSADVAYGISFDMTLKVLKIVSKQAINVNVGNLNIPDIQALKDQQSNNNGADTKIAAGIRVYGTVNAGRQGQSLNTNSNVLQQVINNI
jgi:hypothetical protein